MGLVNRVVPHDELMAEARRWAERLARNAPQAMAATKEVAVRSQAMSFHDALRMGEAFRKLAGGTEDAREGVRAFREKREPKYTGM
jgi:enoyl-CoA hydratase/carnithine racemase